MSDLVWNKVTLKKPKDPEFVLEFIRDTNHKVDFSILLPLPLNHWQGSFCNEIMANHFQDSLYEDCARLWGSKGNALGQTSSGIIDGNIIIEFDCLWGPPRGWVTALFNSFKMDIDHEYGFDANESFIEKYDYKNMKWKKIQCLN